MCEKKRVNIKDKNWVVGGIEFNVLNHLNQVVMKPLQKSVTYDIFPSLTVVRDKNSEMPCK